MTLYRGPSSYNTFLMPSPPWGHYIRFVGKIILRGAQARHFMIFTVLFTATFDLSWVSVLEDLHWTREGTDDAVAWMHSGRSCSWTLCDLYMISIHYISSFHPKTSFLGIASPRKLKEIWFFGIFTYKAGLMVWTRMPSQKMILVALFCYQ